MMQRILESRVGISEIFNFVEGIQMSSLTSNTKNPCLSRGPNEWQRQSLLSERLGPGELGAQTRFHRKGGFGAGWALKWGLDMKIKVDSYTAEM